MNKLKISLLKQARKLVLSKKEQFICIALDQVARQSANSKAFAASRSLQEYIHAAMKGSYTLESWIINSGKRLGQKPNRIKLSMDKEFMINARIQWIDWIIQQLKESK